MFLKDYTIQTAKNILIRFPKRIIAFFEYITDFSKFRNSHNNRFPVKWQNAYPCLKDKVSTTPFDTHYTYHPAWAARILASLKPSEHVDISSILSFGTMLSAFIPVRFYDYRPAAINLSNYHSDTADLTNLPFTTNSIPSLSCMHTIEHIGLGRYGDPLDPDGDLKAIKELIRVLKPGGHLLFVTPVGQPKIEYNAHRIYSFEMIMNAFNTLQLANFSLVTDAGKFIDGADPKLVAQQQYGCGCFHFQKQQES